MKVILTFFALFFLCNLSAQTNNIYANAGIAVTVGAPTYKPGAKGSIVAIDTVTGIWYISRDRYAANGSWLSMGQRIEQISGCSAPAYTPNKYNSDLVINACAVPELYYHSGGGVWACLNCSTTITTDATLSGAGTSGSPLKIAQQAATSGQVLKWNGTTWLPAADAGTTYSAGTGLLLTGTVFSNTGDLSNTNEIQALSFASPNLSLSVGGGAVDLSALTPTIEQQQDLVGAMVSGNTESLITVTYDDAGGKIDFAVQPNLSNYTNDAGFLTTGDGGIATLNGLTPTTQTFATGTAGTDFAINSATSTHTFNLPTASATNRGALSSADWTTFNAKLSTAVTSVGLALPAEFTISGSPVTSTGPLTGTWATQAANLVFRSGNAGGTPSFSALSAADIPSLDASKITTGILPVANGGTGIATLTANRIPYGNGTSPFQSSANLTFDGSKLGVTGTAFLTGTRIDYTSAGALWIYSNNTLNNDFFGRAGNLTMTSDRNIGIGELTLSSVTSGGINTAIGNRAMRLNQTGSQNVAIGAGALEKNVSGTANFALGTFVLTNSTASNNVGIGDQALTINTSGARNIGIGTFAGATNSTGSDNTAVGYFSLEINTVGRNTAVGAQALRKNSTGVNNTALGNDCAYNTGGSGTGSNNLFLGAFSANNWTSGSNNMAIGYNLQLPSGTASNQMTIGNLIFATGIDGTGTTLSTGSVGIGNNAPARKLHVETPDAVTAAVTYQQRITHTTSGTAATGFGAGQETELENESGTNRVAATTETTYTDVTNATEDATYKVRLIKAGTLTDALTLTSVGALTVPLTITATQNILSNTVSLANTGAAATAGLVTLVGGTATVNTTAATSTCLLFFQRKTAGGTIGFSTTYTVSAGTSFTITSDNILDTSVYGWMIVETH